MPPWLYALLGLLILILVSGGYMFTVGCVRKKELPWLDEVAIKQTTYGRFYEGIVRADQWLKDQKADEVSIISEDGLQLYGYWIPVENAKGTVLLAHGYRSNMRCDFSLGFSYYHELGFNILVPYQRSHGKSQGKFITFGVKESRDMLGWIRYHNDHFGHYPMFLYGISMGASTLLYLADQALPENVKGIIADCGFTSPKDILAEVFQNVIHLPAGPTLWAADLFARIFAGFSIYGKDTRKILAKSKLPVLLIHGLSDDFVPPRMSQEGYDACNASKELLLVEGAEHGVSFLVDPDAYTERVIGFLKQYIPGFTA